MVGGGDTGMDCISNAIREGATDVRMLDVYPELPPSGRPDNSPWPLPPKRTLTTYALDEGGVREWNAEVIELLGEDGRVARARARRVEGTSSRDLRAGPGHRARAARRPRADRDRLLAPRARGRWSSSSASTSTPAATSRRRCTRPRRAGVFACGDARVGQSLVVTAIAEGRKCARMVDRHLMGEPEFELEPEDQATITDAHFLELEAQTAGNVTVSDEFFSGPGEP